MDVGSVVTIAATIAASGVAKVFADVIKDWLHRRGGSTLEVRRGGKVTSIKVDSSNLSEVIEKLREKDEALAKKK